jgi:hypothetical protein
MTLFALCDPQTGCALGPVVPLAVLQLGWALEDRGFRFSLADDGCLEVDPIDRLTADNLAALRRWKGHLQMLLVFFATHRLDRHLTDRVAWHASEQFRTVPNSSREPRESFHTHERQREEARFR